MMSRISLVIIVSSFILCQPIKIFAQTDFSNFDLSKDELIDVFKFSHRLLYYQEDLNTLAREMDNEISQIYVSKIDSLQRLAGSIVSVDSSWVDNGVFKSFRNRVDPVVGVSLNELKSIDYFYILRDSIFEKIQEERELFLENLEMGVVNFLKYLPDYLRDQANEDIKTLHSDSEEKILGGDYNRYIMILNTLKPKYKELLIDERVSVDGIMEAYVEVKAEEYQIELAYHFFQKYHQGTFNDYFENVDIEELYTDLVAFKEGAKLTSKIINSPTKDKEELSNYLNKKDEDYFELRENILTRIDLITEKLIDNTANKEFNSLEELIKGNPIVKEFEKKAATVLRNNELDNDFIDIMGGESEKFWTRIKFNSGTLNNLRATGGDLKNLRGELFLVYHPKLMEDEPSFHANELFKPLEDNVDDIQGSISDLYVEVPLGLTITNLRLQKSSDGFKLNSQNGDTVTVELSYASQGFWNNFDYDYEKMQNFSDEFQLPQALGVELHKIEINQRNWQPTLFFLWKPAGFFADLLPSISEKEIELNLENLSLAENDLKRVLEERVKRDIEKESFDLLHQKKEDLREIFFAEKIQIDSLVFTQETLNGQIHVLPRGFDKIFDNNIGADELYISIKYRFYIRDGVPQFHVSKPTFPAEEIILQKIRDQIKILANSFAQINTDTLTQNFTFNLTENIEVKDFIFNFEQRKVCSQINVHVLDKQLSVCLDVENGSLNFEEIEQFIREDLFEYALGNIDNLILNQFVSNEIVDRVCTSIPDVPKLYGLSFEKTSAANDCKIEVKLLDGLTTATLQYHSGGFKIETFNPGEEFKERVIGYVNTIFSENESFIQFDNPHFKRGTFHVNLMIDISKSPEFALLEINPIQVGSLELESDGSINFIDQGFDNLDEVIKQKIRDEINSLIKYLLEDALPKKIDFQGIALVRILEVESKLEESLVKIIGEIDFESLQGIRISPVALVIDTKNLNVELQLPSENEIEEILLGGIIANFMSSFLEECNDGVGVCDLNFDQSTLTLTGVIKIDVMDMLTFPGIEFTLSPKKFDYVLKPKFELKGAYAIAPPVVVLDPSLEFDFNRELITARTVVTMGGGSEEARATAKVAKVDAELSVDLNDLDRADYKGVFKLLSVMPVLYGDGYFDVGKASFGMSQGTTGVLDDIVHFNQRLDFYGKFPNKPNRSFEGRGEINFLDMDAQVSVNGRIHLERLDVSGSGSVDILLAELEGGVATSYIPYLPLSYLLYGSGNLSGNVEIGDFKLSKFDGRVNIHEISARFEVLGARLGLHAPVADALTEEIILDMILEMFMFDLDDLAAFFNSWDEIDLSNISFGFGDSWEGEGVKKKYAEGDGGVIGRTIKNDNLNAGNSENLRFGRTKNSSVRVLNLSFDPVNDSKEKTVTNLVGYDCFKLGPFKIDCDPVYEEKKIKIESFISSKWPGWYSCLPKDYENYYAVYDAKESHPKTKKRVYDLIYKDIGDSLKKIKDIRPFFVRADLVPDPSPRSIDGENSLCLSKKERGSDKNAHCVTIPEISDTVYTEVDIYGNLAFSGDEEKIYAFTSAKLPRMKSTYCRAASSTKSYTVKDFISELESGNSFRDIICHNCADGTVNPEKILNRIILDEWKGFKVVEEKVSSRNPLDSFEAIQGTNNSLLSYTIKMTESEDSLLSEDDIIIRQNGQDNTANTDLDIEDFTDPLYEKTKNLSADDIIVFDKCSDVETSSVGPDSLAVNKDCRMIIVRSEDSSVSVSVDVVREGLQKELDAFYEITKEVFIEINTDGFEQLFEGYVDVASDLSVRQLFDKLINNNYELYYKMRPVINEYIQHVVYYGDVSNTVKVETTSPEYKFTVWDNSNIKGDERFTYTFENFSDENNPLNLKNTDYFNIPISDLTNKIGLSGGNIELSDHKAYIEGRFNSHVYRNLLFFHARDTLNSRLLLDANKSRVIFGLSDNQESDKQKIKLVFIEKGSDAGFDLTESHQLINLDYRIGGSQFDVDVEVDGHSKFFSILFEKLYTNKSTKAYIQQFPADSLHYRAILFTDDEAEMIWEKDPETIYQGVVNTNFSNRWENLTTIGDGSYSKRIDFSSAIGEEEKAEIVLNWFDGFDKWYRSEIIINPVSLFNLNE